MNLGLPPEPSKHCCSELLREMIAFGELLADGREVLLPDDDSTLDADDTGIPDFRPESGM